jgi:8-oxo-dGTP pyrophosphatase MutT (NUDIX family)
MKKEPPHAAADGEEIVLHRDNQEVLLTWHGPDAVPAGQRHGSAGICTVDGNIVLITSDGARWDLPAGRPEGAETWEETLRREMLEEACARVIEGRLLGF